MDFIDIATSFFKAVALELDPYTEEKEKVTKNNEASLTFEFVSHIQFAKYGRGPGKKPPLDGILEWVKKRRFQFRDLKGRFKSFRGTAFIIQASIGKKGTKNYVPNAPNAIEEAISNNILDYYKKLSNFTLDTQVKELQEIYEKNIPRKITLKL